MESGKKLTINVDQVRMHRHRKCDETEIGTGSLDNSNLRDESSGFDRVQRRSNESRDSKKIGSEVKRELEEKGLSFRNNQGEKHTNKTNKRGPLIRLIPSSSSEKDRKTQQGGPVRSKKRQRKERQSIYRRVNKIKQQECQTRSEMMKWKKICHFFGASGLVFGDRNNFYYAWDLLGHIPIPSTTFWPINRHPSQHSPFGPGSFDPSQTALPVTTLLDNC
ncbi:uncharacterized protein TNCV_3678631 [Trichonephila clavipes]|nr:uncharacterized protein TNCV_3678631 [Trichonephila clavipes]